jgi:shikimate kinase
MGENPKFIFLIGFMGSGKTFLGKQLAQLLNYDFIDLDEEIEKDEYASIAEIFSSKGEAYFRSKESSFLKSLLQNQNAVIATGGGTPCFHDNMKWMNEHGISVYLKVSPEILFKRLKPQINHRPLLAGKSDQEVSSFIVSKLHEREQYYMQAALVINGETASPHSILQELTELLG